MSALRVEVRNLDPDETDRQIAHYLDVIGTGQNKKAPGDDVSRGALNWRFGSVGGQSQKALKLKIGFRNQTSGQP